MSSNLTLSIFLILISFHKSSSDIIQLPVESTHSKSPTVIPEVTNLYENQSPEKLLNGKTQIYKVPITESEVDPTTDSLLTESILSTTHTQTVNVDYEQTLSDLVSSDSGFVSYAAYETTDSIKTINNNHNQALSRDIDTATALAEGQRYINGLIENYIQSHQGNLTQRQINILTGLPASSSNSYSSENSNDNDNNDDNDQTHTNSKFTNIFNTYTPSLSKFFQDTKFEYQTLHKPKFSYSTIKLKPGFTSSAVLNHAKENFDFWRNTAMIGNRQFSAPESLDVEEYLQRRHNKENTGFEYDVFEDYLLKIIDFQILDLHKNKIYKYNLNEINDYKIIKAQSKGKINQPQPKNTTQPESWESKFCRNKGHSEHSDILIYNFRTTNLNNLPEKPIYAQDLDTNTKLIKDKNTNFILNFTICSSFDSHSDRILTTVSVNEYTGENFNSLKLNLVIGNFFNLFKYLVKTSFYDEKDGSKMSFFKSEIDDMENNCGCNIQNSNDWWLDEELLNILSQNISTSVATCYWGIDQQQQQLRSQQNSEQTDSNFWDISTWIAPDQINCEKLLNSEKHYHFGFIKKIVLDITIIKFDQVMLIVIICGNLFCLLVACIILIVDWEKLPCFNPKMPERTISSASEVDKVLTRERNKEKIHKQQQHQKIGQLGLRQRQVNRGNNNWTKL